MTSLNAPISLNGEARGRAVPLLTATPILNSKATLPNKSIIYDWRDFVDFLRASAGVIVAVYMIYLDHSGGLAI